MDYACSYLSFSWTQESAPKFNVRLKWVKETKQTVYWAPTVSQALLVLLYTVSVHESPNNPLRVELLQHTPTPNFANKETETPRLSAYLILVGSGLSLRGLVWFCR